MSKKLQHYYLVATKVAFLEPEQQQIGALEINVLVRNEQRNFTAANLGKAQQLAQMQFFDKLQDPKLEVKDVFLISISYLGHMTEEVFQVPPAGTKVQERTIAVPAGTVDPF